MTAFAEFRPPSVRSGTQITASRLGSTLKIDGEVDVSSIDSFHEILTGAAECSVVDFSGVSFFGVVGVRPLVELRERFRGKMITSRAVDRVVRTLGIDVG